jgi:hypothetical protein
VSRNGAAHHGVDVPHHCAITDASNTDSVSGSAVLPVSSA